MTDQANSADSGAGSAIRVLLADDEEMIRHGVRLILRHADGIEVVAEAVNGAEAVRLTAEHRPDVVLLDIRMPVLDGLAAVEPLVALDPAPQVVMLSGGGAGARAAAPESTVAGPTGREREVLVMLGEGISNPEIAKRLGTGVGTVKTHVGSILEKTRCGSRVQAALLAHQAGLMG
ncbi:response regulator transcription factor [Streptomyces inhibens]|uniref:response regulator transcription factor n=1 Tax=Streptomyces inhibens TaxID=2293571 RepID=UPI001EE6CCFA|nr:response regulator transcription factor [Streptomyces inhibens]UKY50323.1 response regulator transcription factor [Streptomyces inhibens]